MVALWAACGSRGYAMLGQSLEIDMPCHAYVFEVKSQNHIPSGCILLISLISY